jgi:hypothetical protein
MMRLNLIFGRGVNGTSGDARVGQHFQRADGAGLVFEVVDTITSFGPPHLRVRRVDDPTDMRVFARSALMDRHLFRAVQGSSLPPRGGVGRLRLSPT